MKPTEKQLAYVNRILSYLGEEKVCLYIRHFYPSVNINNLTKKQAQKIITGLSRHLPQKQWGRDGMSMSWIQSQ